MSLLEVRGLTKRFGGLLAVDDYRLDLPKGEIYGLIGPNGAGKTTVFNLITGYIRPDGGSVRFGGRDITGLPPNRVSELGIARTFQNLRIFRRLTVMENLLIGRHKSFSYSLLDTVFMSSRYAREEEVGGREVHEIMRELGINEYADRLAGELPYGIQRLLEIGRSLLTKPKLLLLDEPTAGMNPKEAEGLISKVREIKESFDLTVLIVEHRMKVIQGLCSWVQVLDHGRIIAEGTYDEVVSDPKVIEVYLGGT
ncbi:MAG: ABC transporter ATP-binding protein [Candidatus Korarchaeota archaeon]|nr:ABC transporter ATP-binding protein [Candidatus Korarchaeota archaeon]